MKDYTKFNTNTEEFLEILKHISKCLNNVKSDIQNLENSSDGREIKKDMANLRHTISVMAKFVIDVMEKK